MDLFRQPVLGAVLRWPRLRLTLQLALLGLAAAIVVHGLLGPQIAPRNLATVLTSIHWRGLLVVALLAIGNLFCTACPMMLTRDAGRRLVSPRFRWPGWLRRKWLAIVLFVGVLFVYELFDLWELPLATAWVVLGYFGLALVVDLTFKGASFCKYVCPIGQFNFVASTMSPAQLQVRDLSVCGGCRTSDCIKGQRAAEPLRIVRRGCELGLFMPTKVGNLDCTLCLDCVRACPHDNIALATRVPGVEWLSTERRSGLGRLVNRSDIAALAVLFTFAALLNAFVMTAPARALEQWMLDTLGLRREAPALALLFLLALGALPAALVIGVAVLARRTGGLQVPFRQSLVPYVFALVPLGFGVWLAHYGFHLFTGVLTVVPVAQSAAIDLFGWPAFGEPAWTWMGMPSGAVFPIQLGFVLLGAAGSIGLVRALSTTESAGPSRTAVPWTLLVLGLAAAAIWIFVQPMDMRGVTALG